ncbi:pyridoxal phosphate-dependent transferase [Calycina marina]|uniref:Pyridoxal phosphate-dependent transferase n=1 Tax=Calycina marina TaxID=1763456 RepID=A0A9P8CDA5_9HELO|nr:pyridoxal phosphate-dependent transferase [Calycina marina]
MDLTSSYSKLRSVVDVAFNAPLPPQAAISDALKTLPASLPVTGLGDAVVGSHLLTDITRGLSGQKNSANYYGFVTGGVLPIAEIADNVATAFDNSVQVHLPDQSISTFVEVKALEMLVELLHLREGWDGKTFTTGATASNILGLACGREAVVSKRLAGTSAAELGILGACLKAGVKDIQILTSMPHNSLYKAASVVGLGHASIKDIPVNEDEPWNLDLSALEEGLSLATGGVVSIVAISAGEVNTGRFATNGASTMRKIRDLCNKYDAWLHVDGAFGVFARCLPKTAEFSALHESAGGLELADSIAGDCHKMLNVPYDCGFFLTKSPSTLTSVFQNPNAFYLVKDPSGIPSPLNIGLENSRRFRALPVYAVLLSLGSEGMAEMFTRQVQLARRVAHFINAHSAYELLAQPPDRGNTFDNTHIIVIFRAKDEAINKELTQRVNATRKIYVSGTKWHGKPAVRIAVSTWKVDVERDLSVISAVLDDVVSSYRDL